MHWTVEQQCVFLTKYGDEYSFDDFPAQFANGLLKVDAKLETNLDWLFGRANNASLPRDSVLDAVIGLESLLVASPGETTYKFALHGTAVLTHYADDVHQELKSLYGLRSKAAHSGASEDSKFTENAPRARQLLAQALYRIAILINGNVLKFEKSDASVGYLLEPLTVECRQHQAVDLKRHGPNVIAIIARTDH